jgi:outer membrane protein OmpA-like peptidoglycan-associated protein
MITLLLLPAVAFAYPDRDRMAEEIHRLQTYLQRAQDADGPVCVPESLAAAQAYLARAMEEFHEGDYWNAEEAIERCRTEARGLWEEILRCAKDLDRDGIPAARDRCPENPETYNGYADEDGCPDSMPRRAFLTAGKIEILEPVRFDEHTQLPSPSSRPVLEEVARILSENSALRVLIQAHLDDRLQPQHADDLTRVRAENVKAFLVTLGIEENRLQAEGKGSREPLASNDSAWGRMLNSRIEFLLVHGSRPSAGYLPLKTDK